MSKYNFDLDMKSDNSNSVIIKSILPNSTVLEIGCAYGRMTKYLTETLHCEVDIMEIDENAGFIAAQYASYSMIGEKEGNILNPRFYQLITLNSYDYVIMADVLEHLSKPDIAIDHVLQALGKDGSFLISVPNIAHNAILIDLWNNKFNYREVGLLDNTHIHFFTKNSLFNLIDEKGFYINKDMSLSCAVNDTELKNSYDDVSEDLAEMLKEREDCEVYQFIWELKAK